MVKKNFFIVVVLFVFVSLACNLTGSKNSLPPTPTSLLPTNPPPSTQPTSTQEIVPTPTDEAVEVVLPPSGLLDAMNEKIASSEWTYEQALVTNLKIFAGEVDASTLYSMLPESMEGTGIVALARSYLQNGSDETAKTEIQRLIKIIFPLPERLIEYSKPAETSYSRPPGLASHKKLFDTECASLWAEGFPTGQSIKCLLYLSAYTGYSNVKVYYPSSPQPAGFHTGLAQYALEGAINSLDTYATYGEVGDVEVVFSLLALPKEQTPKDMIVWAVMPTPGGQVKCQVIVYPSALSLNEGQFRQLIAHEVFHCYQEWHFPKLLNSSQADWEIHDWWGESTAEYFSNVVYPDVNLEWRWIPHFSQKSADTSMLDLAYENFLFFQYLAKQIGDQGILEFLSKLNDLGGSADQAKALSEMQNIKTIYHGFGKAFIDGKVEDTSGLDIPTDPVHIGFGYKLYFGDKESLTAILDAKPFTLPRYLAKYFQEKLYKQETSSNNSDGLFSVRNTLEKTWGDLPKKLPSGCGDSFYYFLVTTTEPGQATYSQAVTATVEKPLLCDPCLVGTWDLYKPSMEMMLFDSMSNYEGFNVNAITGMWRWSFSKDGIFKAVFKNFGVYYSISVSGSAGPVTAEVSEVYDGPGFAYYWVSEPGVFAAMDVFSNVKKERNGWLNGEPMDMSTTGFSMPPFMNTTASHQYYCSAKELNIMMPTSGNDLGPFIYHKVSNSPLP